jgi:hypothetical protein
MPNPAEPADPAAVENKARSVTCFPPPHTIAGARSRQGAWRRFISPARKAHAKRAPQAEVDLPPILLGTFGDDPSKRTVCAQRPRLALRSIVCAYCLSLYVYNRKIMPALTAGARLPSCLHA